MQLLLICQWLTTEPKANECWAGPPGLSHPVEVSYHWQRKKPKQSELHQNLTLFALWTLLQMSTHWFDSNITYIPCDWLNYLVFRHTKDCTDYTAALSHSQIQYQEGRYVLHTIKAQMMRGRQKSSFICIQKTFLTSHRKIVPLYICGLGFWSRAAISASFRISPQCFPSVSRQCNFILIWNSATFDTHTSLV